MYYMPWSGMGEIPSSALSDAYKRLMATRAADLPLVADIVQLHFHEPAVFPAVLGSCETVVARFNPNIDLLREVVLRIVATLQQIIPPEHLAGSVIPLFEGLACRGRARRSIL